MGCLKLSTCLLGVPCVTLLLHRSQQGSSRDLQCLNVPFNKNICSVLEVAKAEPSQKRGSQVWVWVLGGVLLCLNQSVYMCVYRVKDQILFIFDKSR